MAMSVEVIKLKEDEHFVYYAYRTSLSKLKCGEVKIEKANGNTYLEKLAEGDVSEAQARRASWAISRCWIKGEYPEKTYWNS